MDLGPVVHFHRKQAGFTQEELAAHAGVGKTTVFDIEKGKQTVQFRNLLRVLDALNIQLTWSSPLSERYECAEKTELSDA